MGDLVLSVGESGGVPRAGRVNHTILARPSRPDATMIDKFEIEPTASFRVQACLPRQVQTAFLKRHPLLPSLK